MPSNLTFIGTVKAVRADIAKGEITISFALPLNDETMSQAEQLAYFAGKDASDVEIKITPLPQSPIPNLKSKI